MKKYLCMLAVVGLVSSAFAQGTVTFSSGANKVVDQAGVAVPQNGGFAQLFWAPAGSAFTPWVGAPTPQTIAQWLAANPAWKTDASYIKPIALGSRINGGVLTLPTATPGATVDIAVAAWKGTATSFDAAMAGGEVGWAPKIAGIKTGNPLNVPADLPGTMSTGFTGNIQLAPVGVPEPSALALAGLGAAALMIFRRR